MSDALFFQSPLSSGKPGSPKKKRRTANAAGKTPPTTTMRSLGNLLCFFFSSSSSSSSSADDKEWKGGSSIAINNNDKNKSAKRRKKCAILFLLFVAIFLPQIVSAFEMIFFGQSSSSSSSSSAISTPTDDDAIANSLSNRDEAMGTSGGSGGGGSFEGEGEKEEEEGSASPLVAHERDATLPVVAVEEGGTEDENSRNEQESEVSSSSSEENGNDTADNSNDESTNGEENEEEESESTKLARAKLLNDPLLEVFAKISPEVAANLSSVNDDDDDESDAEQKISSSVIDQIFKAAFVGSNSGDAVLSGQTSSGKNYLEKNNEDEKNKILKRLLPKLLSEEITLAKKHLSEDEALANLVFPKKPEVVDGIRDAGGLRSDEISDAEARVMIERRFANAYANSQSEGLASDVDATADAEAKMQQLDAENLLENEKAPWDASEEYTQQNIRKEGDNTEYEFVGGEWIPVEIKDSKVRSEEEKKVVQYERAEKQEAKEDRKEWLISKLENAGLSRATAMAIADGRMSDVMKGGKMSVDELVQREKRLRAERLAEIADIEGVADQDMIDDGEEDPNKEMTWFDRPSIKAKLSHKRFVQCKKEQEEEMPSTEGIPMPTLPVKDYLWKPNPNPIPGTEEFDAGPIALEAAVSSNMRAHKKSARQRAPVKKGEWGTCAVVGNSGLLRLSEYGKSIDSHDVVVRLNQAPQRGYSRRVGLKVTHRVLNRLWTRNYYSGASKVRNKAVEQHPLEQGLTLLISRATLKEYGNLASQLFETRKDILAVRISSRATSMAAPILEHYRERLCRSGFGPYKGLNVPSSGWVCANMLTSLCSKVTVYGFGVEGLAKFSRGIGIGVNETAKDEKHAELNYHYFHGLGARKEGNDVHCFDNEERAFEALSKPPASLWEFCKYKDDGGDRNWNCGCQHANIEKCRLDKLEGEYAGLEDSTDCTPGEDCPEDEAKRKAALVLKEAVRESERDSRRASSGHSNSGSSNSGSSTRSRRAGPLW